MVDQLMLSSSLLRLQNSAVCCLHNANHGWAILSLPLTQQPVSNRAGRIGLGSYRKTGWIWYMPFLALCNYNQPWPTDIWVRSCFWTLLLNILGAFIIWILVFGAQVSRAIWGILTPPCVAWHKVYNWPIDFQSGNWISNDTNHLHISDKTESWDIQHETYFQTETTKLPTCRHYLSV